MTFQLLQYMYERDEIMGIRNVHNVLTPIKPLAGFGIFLSLSHTFPRNTHYRFSNTVKHRNNGRIRRKQTLRYLDALYYFVLLISII